jgi:hypothetical protein
MRPPRPTRSSLENRRKKKVELLAACPAKCVAHRSPKYLVHGILHRSLAGAAECRPRLYCCAGGACGTAAMPGGYAPWCHIHNSSSHGALIWRLHVYIARCFYPAIPAPPGLVMRRLILCSPFLDSPTPVCRPSPEAVIRPLSACTPQNLRAS